MRVVGSKSARRAALGVQRLGEDARHRRLAGPARAREQVRLTHLVVLDGVPQRANDRLLPDDLREVERAVRAVEGRHRRLPPFGRKPPGPDAPTSLSSVANSARRLALSRGGSSGHAGQDMHDVTIDADVGEVPSGIAGALEARGATVRISQLAAGDYLVGDGIGIERKSVLDLHFSIRNRRLWSQLLAYRAALQRLYLLVEGPILDDGRLSEAGVRGALLEIGDRGVTVLRSTDVGDSAAWILRLAVRAQRHGSQPRPRARGRPTIVAPIDLVAGIRGVGPRRARLLLAEFGSVAGIAGCRAGRAAADPRHRPIDRERHRERSDRLLVLLAKREVPGRALRRRAGDPGWCLRRLLGPGDTAAPGRESLALLPSGPDAVRTLPVRGTRPSTPRVDDPCP